MSIRQEMMRVVLDGPWAPTQKKGLSRVSVVCADTPRLADEYETEMHGLVEDAGIEPVHLQVCKRYVASDASDERVSVEFRMNQDCLDQLRAG